MKPTFIIILALVLLLTSCSSSTYRQAADGSVTYHAGNMFDKSDFDVHAMLGNGGGEATFTKPVPIEQDGVIVAVSQMSLTFPAGSVFRITEGGDRTEVAKEVSRGFFAWQTLKSWVAGDVAKSGQQAATDQLALESARDVELGRQTAVSGATGALTNPESSGAGVNAVGNLLKR